jgi:hypothetical protein
MHSFYLRTGREEFYLFSQNFRKGVHEFYAGGVELGRAMDRSRGRYDCAILRTMDKLPKYISYVEKEYDTAILEKTKKHNKRPGCVCA